MLLSALLLATATGTLVSANTDTNPGSRAASDPAARAPRELGLCAITDRPSGDPLRVDFARGGQFELSESNPSNGQYWTAGIWAEPYTDWFEMRFRPVEGSPTFVDMVADSYRPDRVIACYTTAAGVETCVWVNGEDACITTIKGETPTDLKQFKLFAV